MLSSVVEKYLQHVVSLFDQLCGMQFATTNIDFNQEFHQEDDINFMCAFILTTEFSNDLH